MNAVNPSCSQCGFRLESDCDFCPNCGAAKSSQARPTATRDPHAWMQNPVENSTPPSPARPVQPPPPPPPPQIQYVPYAVPAPPASTAADPSGLPIAVRTMGIIALSLMLVGLIPCLGWVNYFNFAFSFITVVLGIVALATASSDSSRTSAIIGLVLVVIANFIGVVRLILGGGCL